MIPIIGQPNVDDWFIALQVKCPCGAQFQLVGQPGSMRACKGTDGAGGGCRRVYKISMQPVLQADGKPGLSPIVYNEDGTFNAALAVATVPQG